MSCLAEVIAGSEYISYDIDMTRLECSVLIMRFAGCGLVTSPNTLL